MRRRKQPPNPSPQDSIARRAALYMRVSTGRQAEHDLSIPDQRRQLESWCRAQGIRWLQSSSRAALLPVTTADLSSSK